MKQQEIIARIKGHYENKAKLHIKEGNLDLSSMYMQDIAANIFYCMNNDKVFGGCIGLYGDSIKLTDALRSKEGYLEAQKKFEESLGRLVEL